MISRATASAGRGPIKLPASAPARTAELKMAIWRIRIKNPPKAVRRSAERNEVLLDGAGAAIAQDQVVFREAPLVAVAFDGCSYRWVPLQEVRSRGECHASVGTNVGFVIVKIGVAHFLPEELIEVNLWRRRRWRWSTHGDGCSGTGGAARTRGSNRVGRRVGGRDLGRALGSDVADIGCDRELRGIGGIPAQGR